ncbi:MAG TPA: hypothetical protein VH249_16725 [Xanthobacteraceae bacterium]|jgi:hypothetical protein|nr:hypothetical protein [Xanthobacteraceae bacterium]
MSKMFMRRLPARQLGALGFCMIAALAASDLARAKDPGKFGVNGTYVDTTKRPPDKAQAGSQKQAIKGFERQQYVKAQCAQLKAEMQNPGLSGGQVQSLMSQFKMLHCK